MIKMKTKKNVWKTTAIILIIVLVVENLLFLFILSVGLNVAKKEIECGEVVCMGYEAYLYNSYDKICDCYVDNEIVYSEVMK